MIEQFISILSMEMELSAEEIADILWLACFREKSLDKVSHNQSSSVAPFSSIPISQALDSTAEKPSTIPLSSLDSQSQKPIPPPEVLPPVAAVPTVPIFAQQPVAEVPNLSIQRQLSIRVPNPPLIRQPLTLARALQPLRQGVFLRTNGVLDEVATAQRIAEQQAWTPVLQSRSEPWLEVALVVDQSASGVIWHSTIVEMKKLLENYGIFRNVQTWGLIKDQQGQIKIRPGLSFSSRPQIFQSPARLVDPTGQRLILIATDCVSSIWEDGSILSALRFWQNNPLAIVQMLPEFMWTRTRLGQALDVEFQAREAASANQRLLVRSNNFWQEFNPLGIKVPVFTLEPEMASMWSRMLASIENTWSPGFIFDQTFEQKMEWERAYPKLSENYSSEERIQEFQLNASFPARKLASLLSGAPIISFPVIRLIQAAMMPSSTQVDVAEIVLGGLFKPLPSIESKMNPDEIIFEFVEGVRERLLETVTVMEVNCVLKELLSYIAAQKGISFEDFLNMLMNIIKQDEDRDFVDQLLPLELSLIRSLIQILKHFNESLESLLNN